MGKAPLLPPIESQDSDPTSTLAYASRHEPEEPFSRLTRGDVATIAVKLFGLYALLQAMPGIITCIHYFRPDVAYMTVTAVPVIVYLSLGIFLVICGEKVARWLLPRTAVTTTEVPGHGPAQIQAMAFSLIGVLVFVWSAPSLAWYLVVLMLGDGTQAIQVNRSDRIGHLSPQLIRYGSETILGVWLFLGSKGLVAWWWRMRHPEVRLENPETPGGAGPLSSMPKDEL